MRAVHLVVLIVPLLVACGSSGDDGSAPGATPASTAFAGEYAAVQIAGVTGDLDAAYVEWGMLTTDGVYASGTKSRNVWTSATPTLESDITYGIPVGPDPVVTGVSRRLILEGEMGLDGGLSEDGRAAVLTSTAGYDPAIAVLVRPGAGQAKADLVGSYHLLGFEHSQDPQARRLFFGKAIFDGAGQFTTTYEVDSDGTISGPVTPSGSYNVWVNGEMTVALGFAQYDGALASGADYAVLGGDRTVSSGARGILVLVRESMAASNATFSGTYHRAGLGYRTIWSWQAWQETDVANGAGRVDRLDRFLNDGSLVGRWVDVPGRPYVVAADGGFDAGWPPGYSVGAISTDGTFAVSGFVRPGFEPRLDVLVRSGP